MRCMNHLLPEIAIRASTKSPLYTLSALIAWFLLQEAEPIRISIDSFSSPSSLSDSSSSSSWVSVVVAG